MLGNKQTSLHLINRNAKIADRKGINKIAADFTTIYIQTN